MSRDHRKLRAFECADTLAHAVYDLTSHFPREEQYVLTAQMRRAALSVPANIVEGCARAGQGEFVNFLNIAMGSVRELGYFIEFAQKREYGSAVAVNEVREQYDRTAATLMALINSLRKPRA